MPKHPLAEVFGYPVDDLSAEAERYRNNKLCPYNNKVPSCTKDKANNPLGVCSIYDDDSIAITCPIRFRQVDTKKTRHSLPFSIAITCPIRFRQDWIIIEDAARFFFAPGTSWTSLQEIRLNDQDGTSAGNIDFGIVAYDQQGRVIDFGSLEVQAVYISGNVRRPFEYYMSGCASRKAMVWTTTHVRPDYLSSSRKRLVPQMICKGGILKAWGKKMAVALHEGFYNTLPSLPVVEPTHADIAWLIYGLDLDTAANHYHLALRKIVHIPFQSALESITTPKPGALDQFLNVLQEKLDEKLGNGSPPDTPTLSDVVIE
jgi:hypothetical protein